MKYIYYMLVIVIVFSGLAAYGRLDTRIKISKPFLTVNDRVISEAEFESVLKRKPSYMSREQFAESVIDKQLLIQEAIRIGINKEESFRSSVEDFYEQSLIKILLDRKLDSLSVTVTAEEIGKYKKLAQSRIFLTGFIYPTLKDMQDKTNEAVQDVENDFVNLSDDLRFALLALEKDESSKPKKKGMDGVSIYKLNDIRKIEKTGTEQDEEFDAKKISLFIQDKKKEQLLDEWTDSIRESAEIWRKK